MSLVKLGVNNGSGDGGGCFGLKIWMDTAKLTNMVIAGFEDILGLVRKGEMFIKNAAEVLSRVVLSEELLILASCLLRLMSRNSVLQEFCVRRFARTKFQDEIRSTAL